MTTTNPTPKNPLADMAHQVERIYITRGAKGNFVNSEGKDCERAVGIVINKKIHWIDACVADFAEINHKLKPLNVIAYENGEWGTRLRDGGATLDKKLTKINKSNGDVFCDGSSYKKRTLPYSETMMWWSVNDLATKYFA